MGHHIDQTVHPVCAILWYFIKRQRWHGRARFDARVLPSSDRWRCTAESRKTARNKERERKGIWNGIEGAFIAIADSNNVGKREVILKLTSSHFNLFERVAWISQMRLNLARGGIQTTIWPNTREWLKDLPAGLLISVGAKGDRHSLTHSLGWLSSFPSPPIPSFIEYKKARRFCALTQLCMTPPGEESAKSRRERTRRRVEDKMAKKQC